LSVLLSWGTKVPDPRAVEAAPPQPKVYSPWVMVLMRLMNRAPRCRGCEGRREQLPAEGLAKPAATRCLRTMTALCENCRSFIEQASADTRVTAVFISSFRREAKYYAGFQASAM
jgi:hypothetical protein